MRAITLYLHIHQPFRYRQYSVFNLARDHNYWQDPDFYSQQNNQRIFEKVTEKSYRPMLTAIEKNLARHPGFKISLSITGTWLDQAEQFAPDLIRKLQHLVKTGRVEIVAETYYHSLAFFYHLAEFEAQVSQHQQRIKQLFGLTPTAFRNTELAYNDALAAWAESAGFKVILAEGWDKILGWRSPGHVYQPAGCKNLRLLLKNYRLSDDLAFRFSNRSWSEWPLTVEKYQNWLSQDALRGPLLNLFMDFETFGEHQWADTGIFRFFDQLVSSWLAVPDNHFFTVSEAATSLPPADQISMPETITWADTERDLSAWASNAMQAEATSALYALRDQILDIDDPALIEDFRRLTTSDHAYYMCTKYWNDGDVHAYFSAYSSPYEAFMYYLNVIRDLEYRLKALKPPQPSIISHSTKKVNSKLKT